MPRQTITKDGVFYRTKLFRNFQKADAFKKCLTANPGFTGVSIEDGANTKGPAWFIQFRPAGRDRQVDMLEREMDKRALRAETEGMNYVFVRDADKPYLLWCYNPKSGEVYEVTTFDCSCPDYEFRCRAAGLKCKHQQARQLQADRGVLCKNLDTLTGDVLPIAA